MKFRKKPVVVEAIQWTGGNLNEISAAFPDLGYNAFNSPKLEVYTLEGSVLALPGDWIIKGVANEFYPCRADIFEATYELATKAQTLSPNDYQQAALKTESIRHFLDPQVFGHVGARDLGRILHALIGLCTEAGEAQDAIKKHLFYGKPLDIINITEEIQDLLWYIAVGLNACGMTLEDAMGRNIAKLKARYGEKFSSERALKRDLNTERAILEGVEGNPRP